MVAGDVTISGAYTTADSVGIDAFVTSVNTLSGGHVFIMPDINNSKFYIGLVQGN